MKKNIERIDYKTREDFFLNRWNGIGTSEIPIALGVSEWEVAASLYLKKVGIHPLRSPHTVGSAWGTVMEDVVADMWRFYSPEDLHVKDHYITYFDEYQNTGNESAIQRKCRRINAALRDPNIPNIFTSLDRVINKGQFSLPDGEINPNEGILEVKTKSWMVDKKFEGGVDPSNIIQVVGQLMITGIEYAEIVAYDNNRKLTVLPVLPRPEMHDYIINECNKFWDLVLKGRELYGQMQNESRPDLQEQLRLEIFQLAPEPTRDQSNTLSAKDFYKAMYKRELEEDKLQNIQGTPEHTELSEQFQVLKAMEKDVANRMAEIQNRFKRDLGDQWYMELDNGKRVSYKPTSNGQTRMIIQGDKVPVAEVEQKIDEILK